jgi:transcriptional regulator with XRE-family HTH domain
LKEARVEAGYGLEKCSALSGVNRVLILRYENGKAVPGIVNAAKIAHVLGVRLEDIREFEHAVAEAEAAGLTTANTTENDGAWGRA